jgi:hypothetical protein
VRGPRAPTTKLASDVGGKLFEALLADETVRQVFTAASARAEQRKRALSVTLLLSRAPI